MDERTQDGRRHRSPLLVAGVATAVLLAGGGGAYWVTASVGGGTTEHSSGRNGSSPGSPTSPASPSTPDSPGTAAIQRPGNVSRAAVEKLAEALGVPGEVKSDAGYWKAGGGAGPTLQVLKAAPGSWSYSLYGTGTHSSSGAAVTEDKALDKAAPLLAALGLSSADTDASQTANGLRTVNADPVVAGLRTHGWSTNLKIDPDGRLADGQGRLSPLTKGDVKPVVISAEQALKELSGPGDDHGIGACPTVVPKESKLPGDDPTLPSVVPCVPSNTQLDVREVVFGLSSQYVAGKQTLVPSWLFEVAQPGVKRTSTLAVPAVDIKQTPSPAPATTTRLVDIVSYKADGSALELSFWGGVCGSYSASADESDSEVKVQVTEVRKQGQVCVMVAKLLTRTVQLDKPLGDREVIDRSDGSTVPKE